jgi:hypothetical protein
MGSEHLTGAGIGDHDPDAPADSPGVGNEFVDEMLRAAGRRRRTGGSEHAERCDDENARHRAGPYDAPMQQPRVPLWFLVANWALVVCAFVVGCMVGGTRHPDLPQPQSDAFGLIYDEILRSHVEEHDGH